LDDLDSPDASPYLDGRAWDLSLIFSPFNLEEVRSYVTYRIGRSPDDGLARRIAAASGGNALLIKDLVHRLLGGTPMPGEPLGREWSLRDLPDSPQRLFTQQIENLSRDGKMLLAVCTLLGDTFPEEAVRVVVPDNFDVDGIFTELFSARILEPSGDLRRLRFRYPQMRLLSIKRLQGTLRRALHARIAGFLATHALSLQAEEAALWRATHTLGSGYPNEAVDILLQAAEESLDAWDPDLAVRRCRQAQLWLYACAQLKLCPPNTVLLASAPRAPLPLIAPELLPAVRVEDLEVASARAAMSLIHAARRLLLPPEDGPDAVVPERITQALLQQVTDSPHLPLLLRADAAFEVGRYLSRVERPQGARRAFQIAHAHARALQDQAMLLHLDMEMANNLQRLGRAGQALDLTNQVIQALRPLEHAPTLPHGTPLRLSRPLDLLAKIYIERRLYPRAEHYLDQALAIAEADNDFDRIGKLCLQYAALYRAQNNHVRTLQALHRALDAAKRTHDLRAMARVLYNQGVTTAHLGHRADARLYLSDAIQVAINLGMTDFIALVNGQLRHL
jgi:tetratricopeptide (TPR) repeat protein